MFTGSARRILHFRKLGLRWPNLALLQSRNRSASRFAGPDLASLPKAPKASMEPITHNDTVGGPPTTTPVGMARLNVVGSIIVDGMRSRFGRGGLGIPTTWQLSTGSPR